MITAGRLHELLEYDPETGSFKWRVDRPSGVKAGDIAGCRDNLGYWKIAVDGRGQVRAHRLAWLYVYGECPKYIDHINMDRSDNRIANLRPATASQNHGNSHMYANNKIGLKGVSELPNRAKPYRATIGLNGKTKTIGYFSTPEQAHAAYVAAASLKFGEFARAA